MTTPRIGNDGARAILGALLRVGGKPISITTLMRFRAQGLPHTKFGKITSYDGAQITAWAERFKRGVYLAKA